MKLRTRFALASALVLALLLTVPTIAYFGFSFVRETSLRSAHSHEVNSQTHLLQKLVIDMETGERGFLIAGREEFLELYRIGAEAFWVASAKLRQLLADDPTQLGRLAEIDRLVVKWHTVAASVGISGRRAVAKGAIDAEPLEQLLVQGPGKGILDEMRTISIRLDTALRQGAHARERFLLLAVMKDMVDMETGQRGYLVTGEARFLELFRIGQANLAVRLQSLRRAIPSDYAADVDLLDALSKSWLEKAGRPEIAAREAMNESESSLKIVADLVSSGTGKAGIGKGSRARPSPNRRGFRQKGDRGRRFRVRGRNRRTPQSRGRQNDVCFR